MHVSKELHAHIKYYGLTHESIVPTAVINRLFEPTQSWNGLLGHRSDCGALHPVEPTQFVR